MPIAIVGGTVVDVIFRNLPRLPSWPAHTEFTRRNLVQARLAPLVTLGGNGANAAYVAAACGAGVTLHTAIADDALGSLARRWLREAGCVLRLMARAGATAVNVTAADPRQRRATLFYPGTPVRLPRLSAGVGPGGLVLVCGWPHPPLRAIAREFAAVHRAGALTALDPGPLLDRPWSLAALRPVLTRLDILLANDHELRALARAKDRATAFQRFRRHYAGHIVLKCGAEGAVWLPAGSTSLQTFAPRKVKVANTVGAGDAFNGALLAALADGAGFPDAIRAANRIAARMVSSPRGVVGARRLRR